jgi:hypothetical protein
MDAATAQLATLGGLGEVYLDGDTPVNEHSRRAAWLAAGAACRSGRRWAQLAGIPLSALAARLLSLSFLASRATGPGRDLALRPRWSCVCSYVG